MPLFFDSKDMGFDFFKDKYFLVTIYPIVPKNYMFYLKFILETRYILPVQSKKSGFGSSLSVNSNPVKLRLNGLQ